MHALQKCTFALSLYSILGASGVGLAEVEGVHAPTVNLRQYYDQAPGQVLQKGGFVAIYKVPTTLAGGVLYKTIRAHHWGTLDESTGVTFGQKKKESAMFPFAPCKTYWGVDTYENKITGETYMRDYQPGARIYYVYVDNLARFDELTKTGKTINPPWPLVTCKGNLKGAISKSGGSFRLYEKDAFGNYIATGKRI